MNDDLKSPERSTPVADETPVVQPVEQKPVFPRKKHSKAFSFVSILLLLAILGAGVLAYFWYDQSQEVVTLKSQNSVLKTEVENLRTQSSGKSDDTDTTAPTLSELAIAAAHRRSCVTVGLPCGDKVLSKVTKIQEPTTSMGDGFAIVSVSNADETNGAKFYLKYSNYAWEVIYDGQNTPPADIVEKFAIPASFL